MSGTTSNEPAGNPLFEQLEPRLLLSAAEPSIELADASPPPVAENLAAWDYTFSDDFEDNDVSDWDIAPTGFSAETIDTGGMYDPAYPDVHDGQVWGKGSGSGGPLYTWMAKEAQFDASEGLAVEIVGHSGTATPNNAEVYLMADSWPHTEGYGSGEIYEGPGQYNGKLVGAFSEGYMFRIYGEGNQRIDLYRTWIGENETHSETVLSWSHDVVSDQTYRFERDSAGEWSLYYGNADGSNMQLAPVSGSDLAYTSFSYVGIGMSRDQSAIDSVWVGAAGRLTFTKLRWIDRKTRAPVFVVNDGDVVYMEVRTNRGDGTIRLEIMEEDDSGGDDSIQPLIIKVRHGYGRAAWRAQYQASDGSDPVNHFYVRDTTTGMESCRLQVFDLSGYSNLGTTDVHQLVRDYAPILRMDSQDHFVPREAAIFVDGATLRDSSGTQVPGWDGTLEGLGAFTATDLYLDLPASTHAGGVTYYQSIAADYDKAIYATIVENQAQDRLAIEYWFPYYMSCWGNHGGFNTHEGDWEGIVVTFDANSGPDRAAYSQHKTTWMDLSKYRDWNNVEKWNSTHPVVYPGRGGHASYFAAGGTRVLVYTEWHDGNQPPVKSQVSLVPNSTSGWLSEYEWLKYGGHWGQKSWQDPSRPLGSDGATGPAASSYWEDPFQWVYSRPPDVNVPPWAGAGGPYFVEVGGSLMLDGSASLDPNEPGDDSIVYHHWDLGYDGVTFEVDATGETPMVPWSTLDDLGLGVGAHTIRLEVADTFEALGEDTTTLWIYTSDPAGAIQEVADELRDRANDPAITPEAAAAMNDALEDLLGKNNGKANNGAVDKIDGDLISAAFAHMIKALDDLKDAEAADPGLDLTALKQAIALTAESLAVSAVVQAEAAAGTPRDYENLAAAQAFLDDAQDLFGQGDFVSALRMLKRAAQKANAVIK